MIRNGERGISLDKLKLTLTEFYWGKGVALGDASKRKMIIIEIPDEYKHSATVVFSVMGSPPKGRAMLLKYGEYEDSWKGQLVLIKHNKTRKIDDVEILKEEDRRAMDSISEENA